MLIGAPTGSTFDSTHPVESAWSGTCATTRIAFSATAKSVASDLSGTQGKKAVSIDNLTGSFYYTQKRGLFSQEKRKEEYYLNGYGE